MSISLNDIELKSLYGEYMEYSIRYYLFDESVVSDDRFDEICKILLENWNNFEHRFKYLTDESALEAGTGYQFGWDSAPLQVIDLVRQYPNRRLKDVFNTGEYK